MESKPLNISELYTTPSHTTRMVDPNQTHVHPIWKNPSGHDTYEKINLHRPFYAPPHTPAVINASTKSLSHFLGNPIEPIHKNATTLGQISSDIGHVLPSQLQRTMTVTPTIPIQA
jgi:hypothetical protein